MVTHHFNVYTFFDMLSDFGGLFEPFVITFFYFVGSWINKHYIMGKFIRGLYYTIDHDKYVQELSTFRGAKKENAENHDDNIVINSMKSIKFTGL